MGNYRVYEIRSRVPFYTDLVYVGLTKKSIEKRFKEHVREAKGNKFQKRHFYNAMRAFGDDCFYPVLIKNHLTREGAEELEKELINKHKSERTYRCLNMAPGGFGGFSMKSASESHRKEWIEKLKRARVGQKPALGMKHTVDNRRLFSEVSRKYWDVQDTYIDKAEDILKLNHKDAKEVYGISTTHYYRLRKKWLTSK